MLHAGHCGVLSPTYWTGKGRPLVDSKSESNIFLCDCDTKTLLHIPDFLWLIGGLSVVVTFLSHAHPLSQHNEDECCMLALCAQKIPQLADLQDRLTDVHCGVLCQATRLVKDAR